MSTKAYSYIRMSSDPQTRGDSLNRQLTKTREFAAEQGWELDDRLRDMGVSAYKGKNVEDGALGEFIDLCKRGEISKGSVLIVENLDRMSRQRPIDAFNIFTSILKLGIQIAVLDDRRIFTEDNMDMGNLFLSIGGMVRAHTESERKGELIHSAWRNKQKSAGDKILTRRCPAWLEANEDKTAFVPIPDRVATVEYIFKLCIEGYGYITTAKRLNKEKVPTFGGGRSWHLSTVQSILRSGQVIGHYQPHSTVSGKRKPVGDPITNYYPAVIDEATYYKAQQTIEDRSRKGGPRGRNYPNLFTGLLRCEDCGSTMTFRDMPEGKRAKARKYVRCYNASLGQCDHKTYVDYPTLEGLVLSNLREFSVSNVAQKADGKRKFTSSHLETLKRELEKVKKRRQRLLLQFADSDDETVLELVEQQKNEEQELQKRIAVVADEINKQVIPRTRREQICDNVEALAALLDGKDEDEVYDIRTKMAHEIRKLVDYIFIDSAGGIMLQTGGGDLGEAGYIITDMMNDPEIDELQKA